MSSLLDLPPELICFLAFRAGKLTFRDVFALAMSNRYCRNVLFGSEWARARAYALLGPQTCMQRGLWDAAAVAIPQSSDAAADLVTAGVRAGMTPEFFTAHLHPVGEDFPFTDVCVLATQHGNNALLRVFLEQFTPTDDEQDTLVSTAVRFDNAGAYTMLSTDTTRLSFYDACMANAASVVREIIRSERFLQTTPGQHIRRALRCAVRDGSVETARVLMAHELGYSHDSALRLLQFCATYDLGDEFRLVAGKHLAECRLRQRCSAQPSINKLVVKMDMPELLGPQDVSSALALLGDADAEKQHRVWAHVLATLEGECTNVVATAVRTAHPGVVRAILGNPSFVPTNGDLLEAVRCNRAETVEVLLETGRVDPTANGSAAVLAALPPHAGATSKCADAFFSWAPLDVSANDNVLLWTAAGRGLTGCIRAVLEHPRFVRDAALAPEMLLAALLARSRKLLGDTLRWVVAVASYEQTAGIDAFLRTRVSASVLGESMVMSMAEEPQAWRLFGGTMAYLVSECTQLVYALVGYVVQHARPDDIVTICARGASDQLVAVWTEAARTGRADVVHALFDAGFTLSPVDKRTVHTALFSAGMDELAERVLRA